MNLSYGPSEEHRAAEMHSGGFQPSEIYSQTVRGSVRGILVQMSEAVQTEAGAAASADS